MLMRFKILLKSYEGKSSYKTELERAGYGGSPAQGL